MVIIVIQGFFYASWKETANIPSQDIPRMQHPDLFYASFTFNLYRDIKMLLVKWLPFPHIKVLLDL